jgi:hypothetical protein
VLGAYHIEKLKHFIQWSQAIFSKPKCGAMSKNFKILKFFFCFNFQFFFLQRTIYFKNPKLQVIWLVFAILSAFFVKIDFV